jgi:hypothetical protein
MSITNGSAPADLREQIKQERMKTRLLEATMRREALESVQKWRSRRLHESQEQWFAVSAYQEVFDRLTGPDRDLILPISTAQDRRYGANWPFWRTWTEHARLRAGARLLHGLSTLAQGAIRGLTNYIVGEGFTFRAVARKGQTPPPALVEAVQAAIDDFAAANNWGGFQRELFLRTCRDGEYFLRGFVQEDDGMLLVRPVEPEWVLEPPGYDPAVSSFGILTEREDVMSVTGFNVAYDGNAGNGETVGAAEMQHVKINVDSTVKRGLTDLCFDTYDSFKSGQALLESLSEGSAVQASIALVRQHDQAVQSEVAGFVNAGSDYTEPDGPLGPGKPTQRFYPGMILDIPKGLEFVAPAFASNAQNFVVVVQAVLRAIAVKWNAPEWLISGDASNNNYSSSITAESPFVKSCKAEQGATYKPAFQRPVRRAVQARADAGGIHAGGRVWSWDEVRRQVDIKCEPPTIEVRNKLEESQTNQIRIQAGAFSPQMWCQEENVDYAQVAQDNEEHAERTGGAGAALPMPDEDGNAPPATGGGKPPAKPSGPPRPPSLVRESKDESGHEHDDAGKFTKRAGGASKQAHEVSDSLSGFAAKEDVPTEYTHPAKRALHHAHSAAREVKSGDKKMAAEYHRSAAYEHAAAAEGHTGYAGRDIRHSEAAKLHAKAARAHEKAAEAHSQ